MSLNKSLAFFSRNVNKKNVINHCIVSASSSSSHSPLLSPPSSSNHRPFSSGSTYSSIDDHRGGEKPTPLIEHFRPKWPEPATLKFNDAAKGVMPQRTVPDRVLRFKLTATLTHGQSIYYRHMKFNPADFKVIMYASLSDLKLTKEEELIFIELVGPRFNRGKHEVKLTCERFPNRIENKRFLMYQLEKLLIETRLLCKQFSR